jgi:hypothetical protein
MSLRNIASGLRALFKRDEVDGELTEEQRGFLEIAVEEKIKQGITHGSPSSSTPRAGQS